MGRFNARQCFNRRPSSRPCSIVSVSLLLASLGAMVLPSVSLSGSLSGTAFASAPLSALSLNTALAGLAGSSGFVRVPHPRDVTTPTLVRVAVIRRNVTVKPQPPIRQAQPPQASQPPQVPTPPTTTTGSGGSGASSTGVLAAGFCAGVAVVWPQVIGQWVAPTGCYGRIYAPNPANYVYRSGFGWCSWWVEVLHPWLSGYAALNLPSHSYPRIGATVYFAPYVQGAGSAGHYAEVAAIGPNGWLLITEMNFTWRLGGFSRVDFRYIHVGSGVSFRW